jgi:hypothetical protein
MKLILTAIALLFASVSAEYVPRNSTAEVTQVQGCYIFMDSKPVKEYKYLGSVKIGMTWGSGQYQDVRNALIKKVRKKYPDADGVILNLYDGGTDVCDAIKFK